MAESPEKVVFDFLQLDGDDRHWVLEQIAGRENGEPIDMYVSAAVVLDPDQFEEARRKLKERGYVPLAGA